MRSSPAATLALVVLAIGALPNSALAQAWLPPRGEGTLTISYQDTLARGELDRNGQPFWEEGTTRAHGLISEVEWGLTDRVALNFTVPFITASYRHRSITQRIGAGTSGLRALMGCGSSRRIAERVSTPVARWKARRPVTIS